ncbi:MAG: hypothetical protein AB9891_09815 [Anaerolineaceae bacterium]
MGQRYTRIRRTYDYRDIFRRWTLLRRGRFHRERKLTRRSNNHSDQYGDSSSDNCADHCPDGRSDQHPNQHTCAERHIYPNRDEPGGGRNV